MKGFAKLLIDDEEISTFLSICIPTFERAFEMQRCLDSLASQKYKNFEVVISDDSNTTKIENLVNKYNKILDIRYFKNYKKLGAPENWNRCIELARGKYINLLHQDDYMTSNNSMEVIYNTILKNVNSKIFISNAIIQENDNLTKRYITDKQIKKFNEDSNIIYLGNLIGPPSVLIFSRELKYIKYKKELVWFSDIEYYYRFGKVADVELIPNFLYTVDASDSGRLTNEVQNDNELLIREHFILFSSLSISKNFLKLLVHFYRSTKNINKKALQQIQIIRNKSSVKQHIIYSYLKFISIYNELLDHKKNSFND